MNYNEQLKALPRKIGIIWFVGVFLWVMDSFNRSRPLLPWGRSGMGHIILEYRNCSRTLWLAR